MKRVGFYPTTHPVRAVAVAAALGYVAEAGGGVQVLDLSNPAQPWHVGSFATAD